MGVKIGNQILTKAEYRKEIKKFCKHMQKKMKKK
jgi:hypothetical protein